MATYHLCCTNVSSKIVFIPFYSSIFPNHFLLCGYQAIFVKHCKALSKAQVDRLSKQLLQIIGVFFVQSPHKYYWCFSSLRLSWQWTRQLSTNCPIAVGQGADVPAIFCAGWHYYAAFGYNSATLWGSNFSKTSPQCVES